MDDGRACARFPAGPAPDPVLVDIATYATSFEIASGGACDTARHCLMEALASGFEALADPACAKLLGPVVPGATMAGGARVPGTSYELDPVQAAFCIGAMAGWLATERGHPSDNLGGILAIADYLSRLAIAEGVSPPTVRDVLTGMIKAHEIQVVAASKSGDGAVDADRAMLVRVASAAVVTAMLGGTRDQVLDAVSNAWIDGGAAGVGRRTPQPGSRRRWVAGDATSRGVRHALLAKNSGTDFSPAPSVQGRGLHDGSIGVRPFVGRQPFGCSAMESVRFEAGVPGLVKKFEASIAEVFGARQCGSIRTLVADTARVDAMPVHEFVSAFVRN